MCVEKINVKFHKMTSYTFSVEARKKLACRYEERVSPKSKNVILLEPLNELASTCLIFFSRRPNCGEFIYHLFNCLSWFQAVPRLHPVG